MTMAFDDFDPGFIISIGGIIIGMLIGAFGAYIIPKKWLDKIFNTEDNLREKRQKIWDDFRRENNYNYSDAHEMFDAPIEQFKKLTQIVKDGSDEEVFNFIRSYTFVESIAKCEKDLKGIQGGIKRFHYDTQKLFLKIEETYDLVNRRYLAPWCEKDAYPLEEEEGTQ